VNKCRAEGFKTEIALKEGVKVRKGKLKDWDREFFGF